MSKASTSQPGANAFLDKIAGLLKSKNDAALSRALEVAPPVISKIRHHTLPVGATLMIRIHELTDMPIREMRAILAGQVINP